MKRTLKILLLATLYVLGLSIALKIIPFDNPPDAFRALFTKNSQSELTWMKIREVAIVALMAWIVAALTIRENAEKAQFDAIAIGILSMLWGLVFRWTLIGGGDLSWYEITDYLTIGLAVPVLVTVIGKSTRGKRRHPIG